MTAPTRRFRRTIGVDYSGAQTSEASLKGLRVYETNEDSPPVEVHPPPSTRKYWTRQGLAAWLSVELGRDIPTIVGIDHGFSFPIRYFEQHRLVARLGFVLNRFLRTLAHGRAAYICRFCPRWQCRERGCAQRRANMAAPDRRRKRVGKIRLSFRCSGICREVHSCGNSVAAAYSTGTSGSPFLAF